MARSQQPRKMARVSKSIERRLNMYALAAGAAGVGAMALAQAAEAKIVYTPANENIPVSIDLNHDGIIDYYLQGFGTEGTYVLAACQYLRSAFCSFSKGTNSIRTFESSGRRIFAAALWHGVAVRPGDRFQGPRANLRTAGFQGPTTTWWGPWFNDGKGVQDRYLGFKFKIKGQIHFGWARLTIDTDKNVLTGYAYETIPNKAIITGQTKGPDVEIVTPDDSSGSLGSLAIGRR
jgi:hypothetical protein